MSRGRLENALSDALEEYKLEVSKRIKEGEKIDLDNLGHDFYYRIEEILSDFVDQAEIWDEMRDQIREEQAREQINIGDQINKLENKYKRLNNE